MSHANPYGFKFGWSKYSTYVSRPKQQAVHLSYTLKRAIVGPIVQNDLDRELKSFSPFIRIIAFIHLVFLINLLSLYILFNFLD